MDPASRRTYYNRCHPFDAREIADRLLQNNAILRYLNDRDWFDIHPAVRQIPGVSEEIARQRNKPPTTA